MQPTSEHRDAVNRRRRITVLYDAMGNELSPLKLDRDEWLACAFHHIDQPGSQVDSICWDVAYGNYAIHPSDALPPHPHPRIQEWLRNGEDWVELFVGECRRRDLETFWNHRIAEVDVGADGKETELVNPVKKAHPDWLLKTWWGHGLWNLSVAEVREFKVRILRELAERYDFDGFQIDYARHVPILPVGRQWELRNDVTTFMRMVREMLLEVSGTKGRPILLSARVPRNLTNCRCDGLDVETWAREGLVDMLTVGSRSFDVDIEGYREALGPAIKFYPCLDDHHTTDGYVNPPIEVFRGVTANWWRAGADGIVTFNWQMAPAEVYTARGLNPGPASQEIAYREMGSPDTLRGKSKTFPVERRGGYPWAEGAFNQNLDAQLPAPLPYDGTPARIVLTCAEPDPGSLMLRIVLSCAEPGDKVDIALNGTLRSQDVIDHEWKDAKIRVPHQPHVPSVGPRQKSIDPKQWLCRIDCPVDAAGVKPGGNEVAVSVAHQVYHCLRRLVLEKVELHLTCE